jgi:hypothetical protein
VTASESVEQLADRLLHQPPPNPGIADQAPCRPRRPDLLDKLEAAILSFFIGFHVTMLLVYSSPGDGVGATVRDFFNRHLEMDAYMAATGNATRWEMFAPDPPVVNPYTRVLVEDRRGRVQDLGHEVFGRRSYPYLFFDRLHKINAWGLSARQNRAMYAAWQCREWERAHGGEPAARVRLVRFMTEIPAPEVAYATGGYQPTLLDVQVLSDELFECGSIPHGQLPPSLRARYGLPPAPEGRFKDVEFTTWRQRVAGAAAIR